MADDVRSRLGLSREDLERAACRPRVRATNAVVMHLADSVWTAAELHLFACLSPPLAFRAQARAHPSDGVSRAACTRERRRRRSAR